ncbi:MAG: GspJ family T2SS minor pseudopilin variant LspJ [Legionella sp.]|uniref:GspJ family T2SS minor pseudopilin variant LspJ n=1 Tax=Legionella sp. TaxID=459 RepID=UPI0039E3E45E
MKKLRGFTLIEILIALTVFAILATITSSTLYHAFNTRTRVNEQSKRIANLQLAISLLQQDLSQTLERAIRANDMRLFPIFLGQADYMEFTRDGDVNPGSNEKHSTLKRVAYVCTNNSLIRRTWDTLDPVERKNNANKVLLSNLSNCHFGYLNNSLQVFPDWRADAVNQNQNKESLPKAVQVNFTVQDQGEMNLLFPIPEALYALN